MEVCLQPLADNHQADNKRKNFPFIMCLMIVKLHETKGHRQTSLALNI